MWKDVKQNLFIHSRVKTAQVSEANDVLSIKYIITRQIEKRGKNKMNQSTRLLG